MSAQDRDRRPDSVESVRAWLSEQGFPLEMRVAEEFRQAGFEVQQSEFYIDQESGKPREIDVVAEKRYEFEGLDAGVRFVFVVECKRATTKPWVFLSTPEARQMTHHLFETNANVAGRNLISNVSQINDLPEEGMLLGPPRSAYGLTTAHRARDQKDDAYSACRAITDAIRGWRDVGELRDHLDSPPKRWAHIRFPLIVIEGALFDAHLDESSNLIVSDIERGRIASGFGAESYSGRVVDVVRVNSLAPLLRTFHAEVQAIEQACRKRPEMLTNEFLGVPEMLSRLLGGASDERQ